MVDVAGNIDDALRYCRDVPRTSKSACYFAIGEQVASLYAQPAERTDSCARVPDAFAWQCRRGAQLT